MMPALCLYVGLHCTHHERCLARTFTLVDSKQLETLRGLQVIIDTPMMTDLYVFGQLTCLIGLELNK
jgi:hypothetical protein